MQKRWSLFHAMDFQSLMYPCFTFCQILGMFPYKINVSTFEISKPRYILSTMITFICSIYNMILIYKLIFKIDVGDMIRTLQIVCYYTISGFILIITHVLSGPKMRLLQTVWKISLDLPPEWYQKLSRLIHVKDIFGAIFLFAQLCIYFSKIYMRVPYNVSVPFIVFTMYLVLLEFEINMLYMNCVCVLTACFKRINENLTHMQKLVVKPSVPRICNMQGNQYLLIKFKTLKKQHLMVSDTVQMLNVIFSLQLLATIIMAFANITFELYSHIVRWQDRILITLDKNSVDVLFISTTFYIIKIMLLIWACETGKNQAREISTIIHEVLNSTSNEQIKNELQLFSLQILHSENTFSAKCLTLDATLLTAMVGNITTYVLIMVQFLIAIHSCDKKSLGTSIISIIQYLQ